jgi:hypothetical protein
MALVSSFIDRKYKDAVRLVPVWSMLSPSGGQIQALSLHLRATFRVGRRAFSGQIGGNVYEVLYGTREDTQLHPFDSHP